MKNTIFQTYADAEDRLSYALFLIMKDASRISKIYEDDREQLCNLIEDHTSILSQYPENVMHLMHMFTQKEIDLFKELL